MLEHPDNKTAIFNWISERTPEGARVLDIGCGRGDLLHQLVTEKGIQAMGIELSQEKVMAAVGRGLSVHHGDADEGLSSMLDRSFDLTVFSLTIQELAKPIMVLKEAFRVSKKVVVVFPNFGYWPGRWQLAMRGRSPQTVTLPHSWFDSPNRHFLTIKDWKELCQTEGWQILEEGYLAEGKPVRFMPNLFAEVAIQLVKAE
ncbi:MAG: methionine biosynthesis protein MetW [Candidatus Omnitrophica bacterium]|nr:methionine biosynthesis protein MetW [Candidatus Omnitrophota bacterium]MCA9443153.1 methionine biosynthesis protein MetW [Candidatus Omnitrophota bacterium]